jgi:uncharacterized membrane protein YcaP (DUF421 family)
MQIVIRASVMFLFVWLVMRAMGRKELAQLSSFELILLIVTGDLIQQAVTQQDNSIAGAVTAISTITLWMLLFSFASFKNRSIRKLIEGKPVVVVSDGKPLEAMLRYERLTVDEVKEAAREQGIADLAQVALGILESDGKFSFIRHDSAQPQKTDERKM